MLSARGGDRRSQDKLLDCLCERCKPLSILSTVQSTSRSASSAIWFKIAAFALSGSASASRRYRTARSLGVIGGTSYARFCVLTMHLCVPNGQSHSNNRERISVSFVEGQIPKSEFRHAQTAHATHEYGCACAQGEERPSDEWLCPRCGRTD